MSEQLIPKLIEETLANSGTYEQLLDDLVKRGIKQRGFGPTYRSLKNGKFPHPGMYDVTGVMEYKASGRIDASLDTDQGDVIVIQNAACSNLEQAHSESFDSSSKGLEFSTGELVAEISRTGIETVPETICEIEVSVFDKDQKQIILPMLWNYILHNRNSNNRKVLTAVGAAVRKYVALMPMDEMEKLAVLLEPIQRSVISPELELEIAKMVYRNFETRPPLEVDPLPALAAQLLEIVQLYINPRILLRDKNSSIASLSIEALVAMQSSMAEVAWKAAIACPCNWFRNIVSDDLEGLGHRWRQFDLKAAAWLDDLRNRVHPRV